MMSDNCFHFHAAVDRPKLSKLVLGNKVSTLFEIQGETEAGRSYQYS